MVWSIHLTLGKKTSRHDGTILDNSKFYNLIKYYQHMLTQLMKIVI